MSVFALLSAERSLNRPIAVARLALSRQKPPLECQRYLGALKTALREEFPPFATDLYGDLYRAATASGQWLATSMIASAERHGESARRLWNLAASVEEEEERQLLKRHACHASHHALTALSLLDLTFPGAVVGEFRAELDQLSPHYSMRRMLPAPHGSDGGRVPSAGDYMLMNIAEIRATMIHIMQLIALASHCPAENRPRVKRTCESLLRDNLSHVAYTTVLIERKTADIVAPGFEKQFCRSVRDFNRLSSEEPIDYSYNQRFGNYP